MQYINTKEACQPAGHYSQAVTHNGLIYISGQLAVDKDGVKHFENIQKETEVALANLDAILKESGSERELVLKTTVYVSDISLWGEVNKVYSEFFGSHKPARAVVPTRELHYGFRVEIEAIAAVKED